jgi:hypothetical protein
LVEQFIDAGIEKKILTRKGKPGAYTLASDAFGEQAEPTS